MSENPPRANEFRTVLLRKREEMRELEQFVHVCENALLQATRAVKGVELKRDIAQFLGEPPPYASEEEFEKAKSWAADIERFAEAEKAAGLPYLFGLCTVRLWALLEAIVDELVVEAMRQPEKCKDQAALSKLKGPLMDFRNASPEEQAEFLAETLKQGVEASLKQGIGRFEAVLDPVGLGGAVDEIVRRALFELNQIRNVIVHKGGRADRRLVESCAWLGMQRGDTVRVSGSMFRRYQLAAYWYVVELRSRVDERLGLTRSPEASEIHSRLREDIVLCWPQPAVAIAAVSQQEAAVNGGGTARTAIPTGSVGGHDTTQS